MNLNLLSYVVQITYQTRNEGLICPELHIERAQMFRIGPALSEGHRLSIKALLHYNHTYFQYSAMLFGYFFLIMIQ